MLIKNKQRNDYEELLSTKLMDMLNENCTEIDDLSINFSQTLTDKITTTDGTDYRMFGVECTVTNKQTYDSICFNTDILKIPVLTDLGFRLKGNYKQVLDLYNKVSGWIMSGSVVKDDLNKNDTEIMKKNTATLVIPYRSSISFGYNVTKKCLVSFKHGSVSISELFKAITNYSEEELVLKFGKYNPFVNDSFHTEISKEDCVDNLLKVIRGKRYCCDGVPLNVKINDLQKSLFNRSYLNLGLEYTNRLERLISFKRRAMGKTLAKDIKTNFIELKTGTILDGDMLDALDNSPIDCIEVEFNGKIYTLNKFSIFSFRALNYELAENVAGIRKGTVLDYNELNILNKSDLCEIKVYDGNTVIAMGRRLPSQTLHVDDLLSVFDVYVSNLNGFDTYDDMYELNNRVVVPFNRKVLDLAQHNILKLVSEIIDVVDLDNLYSIIGNITGPTDDDIESLITQLTSTEGAENQQSDITNSIHFASKSYKVVTDIGIRSATDDLQKVQNLQSGRIDSIDSPESNKIGLVGQKCLFTDETDSGYLTAPFLVVKNGEVTGDVVHLTAEEEKDQYIAEFCETFVDDKGEMKKKIKARINGNIVTVDVAKVRYKEYSQLQNMSLARACIPLQEHSNAKRLLMGCGHQKQAVPILGSERAWVCTGVESIFDAGTYTVSSVLSDYYNRLVVRDKSFSSYKDLITKSPLKIVSVNDNNMCTGIRSLTLEVCNVKGITDIPEKTITISFPYFQRTSDGGIFGYKIIPKEGDVYNVGDIIACNISYDVNDSNFRKIGGYGRYKPDDNAFSKGYGIGTNLVVAYKTFSSTTIDDAITISSRLIADDTLTSISVQKLVVELKNDSNVVENFTKPKSKKLEDKFDYDGLVKVGTLLRQNDLYACVSRVKYDLCDSRESDSIKVYTYDGSDGYVFSKEIRKKDNTTFAEILVAYRSTIEVGDKITGQHGNKGVIANIIPESEMPYDPETGLTVDVCLNPLGIPSRMNISQLLVAALAMGAKARNERLIIPPFTGNVTELAKELNIQPRMLIDGRTGLFYKRPVNVGLLYMYKLTHDADKKINGLGLSEDADVVYLQALKGKKNQGGQSLGEMEAWCFHGMQMNKVLQSLYSVQSGDVVGKKKILNELENGNTDINYYGDNDNASLFVTYARSIGIDISMDGDKYSFKPMIDNEIRKLSYKPVEYSEDLHSEAIFGKVNTSKDIYKSRNMWSYLELNVSIINPLWLSKGSLNKHIAVIGKYGVEIAPASIFSNLIRGKAFLKISEDSCYPVYSSIKNSMMTEDCMTGNNAVLWLLRNYDIRNTVPVYEKMLSKKKDVKIAHSMQALKAFIDSGMSLSDFIISSFPVMPQTFRPKISELRNRMSDFDKWYRDILSITNNLVVDKADNSIIELYDTLASFIGVSFPDSIYNGTDRVNVISYFTGSGSKTKNKDHGKIRTHILSKRVYGSGRAVIVPASIHMDADHIGAPMYIIVRTYLEHLIPKIEKSLDICEKISKDNWELLLNSVGDNNRLGFATIYNRVFKQNTSVRNVDDAYYLIVSTIKNYIENEAVVLSGRQPSLHKYSSRAFKPKVCYGNAIQIHPLVCSGFNADFDGDQMYIFAVLQEDAKQEALAKASASSGFVNGKDGSSVLKISQDIVLGLYCATMLKNNASNIYESGIDLSDIRLYSDSGILQNDIENNIIDYSQLIIYNNNGSMYYSTAGRVMLNLMIPGCLTDNQFTNTLDLPKICLGGVEYDVSIFKELRFDGVISSKKGYRDSLKYIKVDDICRYIYTHYKNDAVKHYQKLVDYGFSTSDRFSVTLTLDDIDIDMIPSKLRERYNEQERCLQKALNDGYISRDVFNRHMKCVNDLYKNSIVGVNSECDIDIKDIMFDRANLGIERLEEFYQSGLVSEESKKAAIARIYNESHDNIKKSLQNAIERNNSFFIIYDSGARGSIGQVMQSSASIGVLQKSRTEDMETPVVNNYYRGLSSFDLHLTTYSTRMGLLSTQKETPNAGYATRTAVYMLQGIEIVDGDCGKEYSYVDIQYKDRMEEVLLIPSREFFEEKLLGKSVINSSLKSLEGTLDGGRITENSYDKFLEGFSTIHLDKESIEINISSILGLKLTDKGECYKYLARFLDNGRLTHKCIDIIEKRKITSIDTEAGTFILKYSLDPLMRSLLIGRLASSRDTDGMPGLPFLEEVLDPNTGEIVELVTEETLDWIESNSIKKAPIRILLDCKSKGGVCARCYGKRVSTGNIPLVGDNIGIEAAQAMGEPSAQLTISLINQGGAAGASIAGGVDIFAQLLEGDRVGGSKETAAKLSKSDGYVGIHKLDSRCVLTLEPFSKDNQLCCECMAKNKCCPLNDSDLDKCYCKIKDKIHMSELSVVQGEYIKCNEPLTLACIDPNDIDLVSDESMRLKGMVQLGHYYNTFKSNGIDILAVNFEILARLQTTVVTVLDSGDTQIPVGTEHEYFDLLNIAGERISTMELNADVQKKQSVVRRYSGEFASLSFEDVTRNITRFVSGAVKSDRVSPLTSALLGVDLREQNKRTPMPKNINEIDEILELDVIPEHEYSYFIKKENDDYIDIDSVLGDIDLFDDLDDLDDSVVNNEYATEEREIELETINIF